MDIFRTIKDKSWTVKDLKDFLKNLPAINAKKIKVKLSFIDKPSSKDWTVLKIEKDTNVLPNTSLIKLIACIFFNNQENGYKYLENLLDNVKKERQILNKRIEEIYRNNKDFIDIFWISCALGIHVFLIQEGDETIESPFKKVIDNKCLDEKVDRKIERPLVISKTDDHYFNVSSIIVGKKVCPPKQRSQSEKSFVPIIKNTDNLKILTIPFSNKKFTFDQESLHNLLPTIQKEPKLAVSILKGFRVMKLDVKTCEIKKVSVLNRTEHFSAIDAFSNAFFSRFGTESQCFINNIILNYRVEKNIKKIEDPIEDQINQVAILSKIFNINIVVYQQGKKFLYPIRFMDKYVEYTDDLKQLPIFIIIQEINCFKVGKSITPVDFVDPKFPEPFSKIEEDLFCFIFKSELGDIYRRQSYNKFIKYLIEHYPGCCTERSTEKIQNAENKLKEAIKNRDSYKTRYLSTIKKMLRNEDDEVLSLLLNLGISEFSIPLEFTKSVPFSSKIVTGEKRKNNNEAESLEIDEIAEFNKNNSCNIKKITSINDIFSSEVLLNANEENEGDILGAIAELTLNNDNNNIVQNETLFNDIDGFQQTSLDIVIDNDINQNPSAEKLLETLQWFNGEHSIEDYSFVENDSFVVSLGNDYRELGKYSNPFLVPTFKGICEYERLFVGIRCEGGTPNQIFLKNEPHIFTDLSIFDQMGNVYECHSSHLLTKIDNVKNHYYRCSSCVTNRIVKKNKSDSKIHNKAATLILSENTLTGEYFAYKISVEQHHENCQNISFKKAFVRHADLEVIELSKSEFNDFGYMYKKIKADIREVARIYDILPNNILAFLKSKNQLRKLSHSYSKFSGMNRFRVIEEIRYSYNLNSTIKNRFLRYERDELDIQKPCIERDVYADSDYLIFTTPSLLKAMAESDILASDGTYSTFPNERFKVLYSIHAIIRQKNGDDIRERFFHTCCILLKDERKETFLKAFSKLISIISVEMKMTLKCKTWLVDKQQVVIYCINRFFPNIDISLCFFHFCNNIITALKNNSLIVHYVKCRDEKYDISMWIKRLMAIVFLPQEHIREAFNEIGSEVRTILSNTDNDLGKNFNTFYKYLSDQWINCSTIPLKSLCKFKQKHRTTNVCEGFHSKLVTLGFSKSKSFGFFGIELKDLFEEEELALCRINSSRYFTLQNQKIEYRVKNDFILEKAEKYETLLIDKLTYLDTIASTVISEEHKRLFNSQIDVEINMVPSTDSLDMTFPQKEVFPSTEEKSPTKPPTSKARAIRSVRGIKNNINSCYAISALHLLFSCENLVSNIMLYNGHNKIINEVKQFLADFMKPLKTVEAINADRFFKILHEYFQSKNIELLDGRQHDVQEFIQTFLELIEENISEGTSDFKLLSMKEYECGTCEDMWEEEETIDKYMLQIGLGQKYIGTTLTISQFLKFYFDSHFETNCKVQCSKCNNEYRSTYQNHYLKKYPKYLFIHVCRLDFFNGKQVYNNTIIEFVNENLYNKLFNPPSEYKLKGYINFEGVSGSGHYKAFLRRPNNTWIECNDNVIKNIKIFDLPLSGSTILLYIRE